MGARTYKYWERGTLRKVINDPNSSVKLVCIQEHKGWHSNQAMDGVVKHHYASGEVRPRNEIYISRGKWRIYRNPNP